MAAHAMAPSPTISFRMPVLPWSTAADDERRFKRILRRTVAIALLLGLVLPFVPLRQVERSELQPLPPPIAKLLLDRPLTPPTPPAPPKAVEPPPKATDVAIAKPQAPDRPAPQTPPKKAAPVPEARQPVEGKPPGEVAPDNARRRASGVGLLAMKNELADMTGAPVAVQLRQGNLPGPGVGSGSGPGVGAGTEAGVPVRALLTSNATRGSGGINTAGYSRDTGGGGLAGRATTLVEGVAGGGGGGGAGGGNAGHGNVQRGTSGKAARSVEEIKLVFERNKGAIYAIYNRALREDPSLVGKVVLSLTIAPSGEVVDCKILSSELKAPELERKLLARIKQFDFGAKDVDQLVISWPVDFLPS